MRRRSSNLSADGRPTYVLIVWVHSIYIQCICVCVTTSSIITACRVESFPNLPEQLSAVSSPCVSAHICASLLRLELSLHKHVTVVSFSDNQPSFKPQSTTTCTNTLPVMINTVPSSIRRLGILLVLFSC